MRVLAAIVSLVSLTILPRIGYAEEPLSIEGLNQDQLTHIVHGMILGMEYSRTATTMVGEKPLYCLPNGDGLNIKYFWELASGALEGPHEPSTVAIAVLDELKTKHPCI